MGGGMLPGPWAGLSLLASVAVSLWVFYLARYEDIGV